MANDLCSFVDGSAEGMSNIFDMNPDNTAMELQAIAYPKADGVDEVHVGYESSLIKNSDTWAVSTACGDYTDLLKLVNWLYSDEGQLMYNWGEEGVAFEYDANGDPQWTDLVVNNADGLNFMFASYLYATGVGSVYFPGVYDMEKGFYSYNDEQLEAVDVFADLTDGAYNLPSYVSLTLEETAEYNGYATDLDTYTEGMILKFIMGDEPLSNYDAFLETCMSMGLDRMTELYQGAYDRGQEALSELD
jgi:putative aldouronate transport system substrate-binding protein